MADSISPNEADLDSDRLQFIPTNRSLADDAVSRLMAEGPIGMTCAASIFGSFRDGRPTHSTTVTRWAIKGIKLSNGRVLKLESFRLNGRLATSRPAILRFVQAQQSPDPVAQLPRPTPAQRNREAKTASAELDSILNGK